MMASKWRMMSLAREARSRSVAMPGPWPWTMLLVMQPNLEVALANQQRLNHPRPHLAGKQRQNVGSAHWMTQRGRLREEFLIEGAAIDLATLEERPCVGIGIGGVDSSDEVPGQAALGLIAVEGLEGRGGEDTAEIPNHRFYDHAFILPEASRTPRHPIRIDSCETAGDAIRRQIHRTSHCEITAPVLLHTASRKKARRKKE